MRWELGGLLGWAAHSGPKQTNENLFNMSDPASAIFIPYTFVVSPAAAISGNGSVIVPVLISEDYDVEIHEIFGISSLDSASDIRPNNFSVLITDKGNGRQWSDQRIPQAVFARVPTGLTLQRPIILAKKSNLSCDFLNLSGSSNTPTLVFVGAKVVEQ